MLLAEELALIAIDPDSGRHTIGIRDKLNACLAGLLVIEVQLADGSGHPLLTAAGEIFDEAGPKLKSVLSAMDRGLERRLGHGTWDVVVQGLVAAEIVAPAEGTARPRHRVLDGARRDEVVDRLRAAAVSDDQMPMRTAVLLSMTGPAQLLELVAPTRATRKHARRRIDHALDDSSLGPVADSVRKVLADAAAAVAAASAAASIGAVTG